MARGGRGKTYNGRDGYTISRLSLPRVTYTSRPLTRVVPLQWWQYQDRRLHTPQIVKPPGALVRRASQLKAAGRSGTKVRFAQPDRIALCRRRRRRREVLFAIGKSGRNGGKKYHRNYWSDISCGAR